MKDKSKVGKAIAAIKALFKLRKQFKNTKEMNLESIRKFWTAIGGFVLALSGASWMPQIILDAFSETGTAAVLGLFSAAFTVFQFFKSRTGGDDENAPQQLRSEGNKLWYALWPFTKAD